METNMIEKLTQKIWEEAKDITWTEAQAQAEKIAASWGEN